MKKSLKVGVAVVALLAISGTLLAQSYGTSTIQKMKEGVKNFTLSWDLNNGQSGLQSAPLTGKRTGDMLTAAEYNRMLELISEGGGTTVVNSGGTGGSGWTNITNDTGNFDISCAYRWYNPSYPNEGGGSYFYASVVHKNTIFTDWSAGNYQYVQSSNKSRSLGDTYASNNIRVEKNCGGGSGGGSTGNGVLKTCYVSRGFVMAQGTYHNACKNISGGGWTFTGTFMTGQFGDTAAALCSKIVYDGSSNNGEQTLCPGGY